MNSCDIYAYYHQVRPWTAEGIGRGLGVSPESVVRHARYLREAGYRLQTASETAAALGTKSAALTFDDGYADNLEHAVPALASLGATGTIYVVVSEIGRNRPSWTPMAVPETDRLLTAVELAELGRAGWEIGSHCLSHVRLPSLSEAEQREELRGSKARLEDLLGRPVWSLAYPYGEYSELTLRLAEETGYRSAVTTAKRGGGSSPFAIARYSLGGYGFRAVKQALKLKLAVARRRWSA